MSDALTDAQWTRYERDGYLHLGRVLSDAELAGLQQRIDDIMLGKATTDYDKLLMQLDSDDGDYATAPEQSRGHKGATLDYRKIQDLERDPLFLAFMQKPVFRDICARAYGPAASVSAFRAMFMNKPANKGTFLPWHQDRWTFLDRDPEITLWTALDPATVANGCVQIIPQSHKLGLINPEHSSGFLKDEHVARHCDPKRIVHLELQPGEAVLMHNWLLHASDVNRSGTARRAFSVCYMDAKTRNTRHDTSYPVIFGENALDPHALEA
ncbi:MAG: phytanoyl-CoA dioxygenase family protein [Phycisphaeraceae bacterium]